MAATQQTQAIQVINQLISLANQLMSVNLQVQQIDQTWTDNGLATVIANMGTVILNADGSTGAADGTPNTAHPLNPATYTSLTHLLSSTQITQIKTILDTIPTLVSGSAVTAQGGARAILNAAVGG